MGLAYIFRRHPPKKAYVLQGRSYQLRFQSCVQLLRFSECRLHKVSCIMHIIHYNTWHCHPGISINISFAACLRDIISALGASLYDSCCCYMCDSEVKHTAGGVRRLVLHVAALLKPSCYRYMRQQIKSWFKSWWLSRSSAALNRSQCCLDEQG